MKGDGRSLIGTAKGAALGRRVATLWQGDRKALVLDIPDAESLQRNLLDTGHAKTTQIFCESTFYVRRTFEYFFSICELREYRAGDAANVFRPER